MPRIKKREIPPHCSPKRGEINDCHPETAQKTCINIPLLENFLSTHPDKQFVEYLITGLKEGFYTGIKCLPTESLVCKNLLSSRSQPEITCDLVKKEIDKGFVIGPFSKIPYDVYRINPIGIAEGKYSKKKRLIVDLSSPHQDSDFKSLNDLIDKEEFSLQYVTIDHAIDIIKKKGQGSWLCKTDISDAFKLIPIHHSLWPFHGIAWQGKYYFFTRLVFGSRSSPKIFDTLSSAICWVSQNVFNIENILHLLDDFLTIDAPNQDGDRTMALLTMIFNRLNIPIAPHKTVGPTTCLEYLGILLDTVKMEARLPEEKNYTHRKRS